MKDLTKGSPSRLILSFAIPIFFANLLQLTYSLVDTRIVGSFLGEDALAAVGATSTLSNLIIGFLLGLANGFAIITAQRYGAKDIAGVKKSFAASLMMGTGISVLLTAAGLIFLKQILQFLNVPEALFGTARSYIVVIVAGMLATFLYDACAAALRALGGGIGWIKHCGRFIFYISTTCRRVRCGGGNGTVTGTGICHLLDIHDPPL